MNKLTTQTNKGLPTHLVENHETIERAAIAAVTTPIRTAFAWQRMIWRATFAIASGVALLGTTGCSNLDMAARVIDSYCAATTDDERTVIRARVNERISPHEVLIYCARQNQ